MKKRILVFLLILSVAAVFGLTGCGDGDKEKNNDVTFDYDYDLSEYIELGEYIGLEYTPTTLVVKEGDTASIDFVGEMDGEVVPNATGSTDLVIGSNSFIDGFEDGLIGAAPEDVVVLDLKFPDPYEVTPEMSGKDIKFTVTVRGINGFDSSESADENNLWNSFFKGCNVLKYPEAELQAMIDQRTQYYEAYAQAYGMQLSDLIANLSITEEDFQEETKLYAEQMVAQDMALFALSRIENITVTEEDYQEAKTFMYESYGVADDDGFKETLGMEADDPQVVYSIETTALLKKALAFLMENAVAI